MAHIRPFTAIRYARRPDLDLSRLIAPPYDVLDEKSKAALQSHHPNNIVTIDLPHLPPKTVGPDAIYEQASIMLHAWLRSGVLARDTRAALYAYTQSYEHAGRTFHRRGFFSLVRLSPFGAGEVIPHEKTYDAPIEDRLKLMRATGVQLSPIFGLYSDPRNEVTNTLYERLGRPEMSATLDGVRNDLWAVTGGEAANRVIDLMSHRPIYIADGHHRYTTAVQYQNEKSAEFRVLSAASQRPSALSTQHSALPSSTQHSALPAAHPANWCLFVLIAMQDDGLQILPTHRLIGNLSSFSIDALDTALGENADLAELSVAPDKIAEYAHNSLPKQPPHTFGIYDGVAHKLYQLHLKNPDVLKKIEPAHSDAWRHLDVAILQRYLLDEVIAPKFGAGKDLSKGYTADAAEVVARTDGRNYQIALLLQSTPLHALEELGKHGEVMPQKSTYFYPKLATGMVINPLT